MVKVSNRQVVEELKVGNRLGCRHLVELFHSRLLEEARGTFRLSLMDAEEVVDDVLLMVTERIDVFQFRKSDADFQHWVMTIFRNRVRDVIRHQALTGELKERFSETMAESDEIINPAERQVLRAIVRQYEESMARDPDTGTSEREASHPPRLQLLVEVLEEMETWERVLLRCRALDVPYEEIAHYTGKTPRQLKVYHARSLAEK